MEQKKNIHHGKFISELIERSGKSVSEIIDLSTYSRTSIYRWFGQEHLDMEKVHRIALACGIDVSGELPELDYYRETHHKLEDHVSRPEQVVPKDQYVDLLEKLSDTSQKLNDYQERYITSKERIQELEKELEKRDKSGT